jgi:PAS domain S-box-containing protein
MKRSADASDRERFEVAVDRLQDGIQDRVDMYVAMLRAGAAMLTATGLHTPDEFHTFAERLQLQARYPGVQGIGYSQRIEKADLASAIAERRRFGDPAFHVWPASDREEYHSIMYLEPLDRRNKAAIGYDMFTDATRRAAMERARDTGEPAASGRVTLVQEIDEQKQAGFLIYMPVYDGDPIPAGVADRRRRLRGFVYSPFRADDLFEGILGRNPRPRAAFELFDGAPAPESLLHRSGAQAGAGRLTTTRMIDVAGRQWTARVFSTPALDLGSTQALVPLTFWAGGALTIFLSVLALLQVRARERAERSEAAVEDAARQFQQLANTIPQLAWMARPDGSIYWYNDRWYEYTGTTPEQMAGGGWQQVHDPGELPAVLERWRYSLKTGDPFEMEFPLRGSDGQLRLFLTRAVPVRHGGTGAIAQWFGTNTDVQYRRDAERSLQEQTARLETVNRSERAARAEAERVSRLKDEFLATLSHELRTPLNAVMGWAHMLSSGNLPDDHRRMAIETIVRNARIQSKLIDDLLDMSRIISGRLRIEMALVNFDDAIDAALNVVRPTADAKRVQLTVESDGGVHTLRADSSRLQQVLWNLLTNAIKFTPAGGRVVVSVRHQGEDVELSVSDTGVGITADFLPHVFERFRQADGSFTRGHGGLGLGLSIARSLVEMHGGTIEASSEGPNRGATFTIRLPAAVGSAAV